MRPVASSPAPIAHLAHKVCACAHTFLGSSLAQHRHRRSHRRRTSTTDTRASALTPPLSPTISQSQPKSLAGAPPPLASVRAQPPRVAVASTAPSRAPHAAAARQRRASAASALHFARGGVGRGTGQSVSNNARRGRSRDVGARCIALADALAARRICWGRGLGLEALPAGHGDHPSRSDGDTALTRPHAGGRLCRGAAAGPATLASPFLRCRASTWRRRRQRCRW